MFKETYQGNKAYLYIIKYLENIDRFRLTLYTHVLSYFCAKREKVVIFCSFIYIFFKFWANVSDLPVCPLFSVSFLLEQRLLRYPLFGSYPDRSICSGLAGAVDRPDSAPPVQHVRGCRATVCKYDDGFFLAYFHVVHQPYLASSFRTGAQ